MTEGKKVVREKSCMLVLIDIGSPRTDYTANDKLMMSRLIINSHKWAFLSLFWSAAPQSVCVIKLKIDGQSQNKLLLHVLGYQDSPPDLTYSMIGCLKYSDSDKPSAFLKSSYIEALRAAC